jgi:hypothetical protein
MVAQRHQRARFSEGFRLNPKLSARAVPRGGGDNERRWLWGPTKRVRMTSGTQNALNRVRGF